MAKRKVSRKASASTSRSCYMSETKFDLIIGTLLVVMGFLMTLEKMGILPGAIVNFWPVLLALGGFVLILNEIFRA